MKAILVVFLVSIMHLSAQEKFSLELRIAGLYNTIEPSKISGISRFYELDYNKYTPSFNLKLKYRELAYMSLGMNLIGNYKIYNDKLRFPKDIEFDTYSSCTANSNFNSIFLGFGKSWWFRNNFHLDLNLIMDYHLDPSYQVDLYEGWTDVHLPSRGNNDRINYRFSPEIRYQYKKLGVSIIWDIFLKKYFFDVCFGYLKRRALGIGLSYKI